MLPFLTLLSSRPARLLSELPADRINASALQSLTQARCRYPPSEKRTDRTAVPVSAAVGVLVACGR